MMADVNRFGEGKNVIGHPVPGVACPFQSAG